MFNFINKETKTPWVNNCSKSIKMHMFRLSRFEREAPVLRGQLPSCRFFLNSPVFRWSWLVFQIFINFSSRSTNSIWNSWLQLTKLDASPSWAVDEALVLPLAKECREGVWESIQFVIFKPWKVLWN